MKTAIVHDWLTALAGGEKVLEEMLKTFPSPLYVLLKNEMNLKGSVFENQEIFTSFIQKLPFARKKYRNYLPLFPLAIEQFDLSLYDVVLSSSHCVAKGVLTNAEQLHICYCNTPMRYAWDLYFDYLKEKGWQKGFTGAIAKLFLHYLRNWDSSSAQRVDAFIGNSHYIARRIAKIYKREAAVIYPPVAVENFKTSKKEDFYLTASRLVPYKKIDMIVAAFSQLQDKKLIVIGDGPEMNKVKAKAGKNVEILGYRDDTTLREYLSTARAFIFAALEDFGILPVEAMASGTPVIAYGKGGALETVVEGQSGLFFHEQTVASIVEAVQRFEKEEQKFVPEKIRESAQKFSKERFRKEFKEFVEMTYHQFKKSGPFLR